MLILNNSRNRSNAVDQYGGGRTDPHATATARLWYAVYIAAAGLPMMFMGTEWAQGVWWHHITDGRRLQRDQSTGQIGGAMMIKAVAGANKLRAESPALRRGWAPARGLDQRGDWTSGPGPCWFRVEVLAGLLPAWCCNP